MERTIPVRTPVSVGTATTFIVIGLALYLALLAGAEWLTYRNGHMNPILKIEQAKGDYDWVILGASHAMPLDYDDFNSEMQTVTGQRILNLAGPGTGPLYNRFTLEHFFRRHKARHVLYVVDAFAFRSPEWNELRFADPKLLGRTPLSVSLMGSLASYVWNEGVGPRAWLDYATGFSKLNNRRRFERDLFEGEALFDRVFKPSEAADKKRIEYLYPSVGNEEIQRARYFSVLAALTDTVRDNGATLVLAKFPVPRRFAELLPGEAAFDAELETFAGRHGVTRHDFSSMLEGREYYADTDHLNRVGARALFDHHLRALLISEGSFADQAD